MKPSVLYHSSSNRDIEILEPRAQSVRDSKEGPVVFATQDKILASMFLVKSDDSFVKSGLFSGIHYYLCGDEELFRSRDMGGAIYTLPSDTFENDPTKGLGKREWTSKVSVSPLGKEIYESGLEAMLQMGVQVYFVDRETFEQVERSDDHGLSIIRGLRSVNVERGINVRKMGLEEVK